MPLTSQLYGMWRAVASINMAADPQPIKETAEGPYVPALLGLLTHTLYILAAPYSLLHKLL